MRRLTSIPALIAVAVLGLSGCGTDTETNTSDAPVTVHVTLEGGKATTTPSRDVDVAVGQDVILEITSDTADELHVHSSPEQEHEFSAGTSRLDLGSFSVPGQIDVEVHDLDLTVVTLVVE